MQHNYRVCHFQVCASVCAEGELTLLKYLSSTFHIYCTSTECRGTLGSSEFTANGSFPIYLPCPSLLLTLGSAVPQHPLLKTSFTKSQSVSQSKQPHLKSVPELHTAVS